MRFSKYLVLLFLIVFTATKSFSQNGCVIYYGGGSFSTIIYTTVASGTMTCNGYTVQKYSSATSTPIPASCSMVPPSPDNFRQCAVNSSCGLLTQSYMVCSIDDNLLLLLFPFSVLIFFYIRRCIVFNKNSLILINT